MKYILIACLMLLLVPVLSACGGSTKETSEPSYTISEPGTWTDGTYTAQADGYAGSFTVTVTIADGRIANIEAGDNDETPQYGGEALKSMIPEMIDNQTYDVDSVSGATHTSSGLRAAVAQCLEEASK